jgi:hypothetical protein
MEHGQIWIAGKGEWKNYLRIDWAAADKELKNKFFTRSKQAEKTLFTAGRQGMSSHCSSCDALVAHFAHQTSDN